MKRETINKILDNWYICHEVTYIGQYAYRPATYTNDILRCKRGDEHREFIDPDGTQHGCWKVAVYGFGVGDVAAEMVDTIYDANAYN